MATQESIPAIKVTVYVNGEVAQKHEDPDLAEWRSPDNTAEVPRPMNTCYIESRVDAEFSIRVQLNEGYTWADLPLNIIFLPFINNEPVDCWTRAIPENDSNAGIPAINQTHKGFDFFDELYVEQTGQIKCVGFKFASIKSANRFRRSVEEADDEGILRETTLVERVHNMAIQIASPADDPSQEELGLYGFFPRSRDNLEHTGILTSRTPQKENSPEATVTGDDGYRDEYLQSLKNELLGVEDERARLAGEIAAIEVKRETKRQRATSPLS